VSVIVFVPPATAVGVRIILVFDRTTAMPFVTVSDVTSLPVSLQRLSFSRGDCAEATTAIARTALPITATVFLIAVLHRVKVTPPA
jgi:hypothetical protein